MYKSILPLLLLISLLFSCSSEFNDLDRSGLKGKVKSIKEMQFESTHENDRWVAGKANMYGGRIINYDPDGLYVESFSISNGGDTAGISSCKRKNGEMIEENFQARRVQRGGLQPLYDPSLTSYLNKIERPLPETKKKEGTSQNHRLKVVARNHYVVI